MCLLLIILYVIYLFIIYLLMHLFLYRLVFLSNDEFLKQCHFILFSLIINVSYFCNFCARLSMI